MVQTKNVKTGEERAFNPIQWDRMGKAGADGSKKGWVPIATQTAQPVNTSASPVTGSKKDAAIPAKKNYALYEERLAKLIAVDERCADMDLCTMLEEKFNEMLETIKAAKLQETMRTDAKAAFTGEGKSDETKKDGPADKEAFLAAATKKNLSKNMIKDYFDKDEVKQTYANKAGLELLTNQLGEYLGWSIEKLNENF